MDFLSPVLNLIGSLLLNEYARINGISDKLKTWGRNLPTIRDVMDSAEEKHMDCDPAVGRWLADLRDVAYDMEDLLEELSVEAKRNSSKVGALSRSTKLPYSLIGCCYRFNPHALFLGHRVANEIEEVDQRLEEILNRISILGLVRNPESRSYDDQPRFITTSVREPKFVGREKQIEELLARLTQSKATEDSIRPFTVVSIVGMGGLGKTTLAQELYHHKSLEDADFTVKAWACVSDVFDSATITKNILKEVAPSSSTTEKDLNQVQKLLNENLFGKKFLIVLDDVWNDNYVELDSLLKPLYSGSKGSMVLVTTRNLEVAKLVGDRDPRQLDQLPLEDCLSLLAYHSIGEENFERHPHLQDIAVRLAEKCKGLPLFIKTIGGLLRFKTDDESWERVLADGSWDKGDGHGKIPPALKLSYVHLPVHLKRCFAACALFPKDYIFDQDEVIRLWIIQGLLHKGTATTYQEVGMKNLCRLEAVSLLQKARDEKTCYLMHDLINDLAKSVVVNSYFSSDEYKEDSSSHEESLGKVRHAAMVARDREHLISKRFDSYRSMKKLRTFMPFQILSTLQPNVFVSSEVIQGLIVDMKYLRMLSLRYFRIREVPNHIGELKLLRSIDFSYTEIQVLPQSICNLVELQSLLLRGCKELKRLPRNIHKLTNLLLLDIRDTNNLEEMPPHIGKMTNLEVLSGFVVGQKTGQELKQLGPLNCIQGELHVRNLLVVSDVEDAKIANISRKEAVRKLTLDWGSISETSSQDDHQLKLLDYLQPPRKIEYLSILYYGGKRFPSWFDNHCLENVVFLSLEDCKSVDTLPPIGRLPLLESLFVGGLEAITSIGAEVYGIERPFRSLKELIFANMSAWEKWSSNGEYENDHPFPCLQELIVSKCPKLKGGCTLSLPSIVQIEIEGCDEGLLKCMVGLTSVTKMRISEIPQLVHFEKSYWTSLVALEEMRIEQCPRFKTFVDGDGEEQVPPKLKKLEIEDCEDLEKLPEGLSGLASLNEMSIVSCGKLSSFPRAGLPPGLRKLKLRLCPSLPWSQLISNGLPESLEELNIENLEGLESILDIFVGSQLSRSLRILTIIDCVSLRTLSDSLQHLSTLSELTLEDCPALEIGNFPALPSNLSSFKLMGSPKVKSLPDDMHDLTSLKSLEVMYCEGITRFPKGGLPPNLDELAIGACQNLSQPIEEWGLRGLASLKSLVIVGEMECMEEMDCFPPSPDGWGHLLPSSLSLLAIYKMNKLERVGSGLRAHLTSLQVLSIYDCPRMRWLPEDGFPDSLGWLTTYGCPQIEKKCSKPNGVYWPLVRYLPRLDFNGIN